MRFLRVPSLFAAIGLFGFLQACGGHAAATNVLPDAGTFAPVTTPADSGINTISPMSLTIGTTTYPTNYFMPSTTGKIRSFQIFDETNNGTISSSAASVDGIRYSAVWGARVGMGSPWRVSNSAMKSSYYFLADADMSTTAWGAIGHSLTWWKANHPSWILYKCSTTTNAPTTLPAYDSGLPNIPLDIHNPAVVQYQVAQMAGPFAARNGYTALAADEVTYWIPATGGSGYYGCGIYQNGVFVRRYKSGSDPAWTADLLTWVKTAHSILNTNTALTPYHLKLVINHPGRTFNTNEATLLSNVDAVLDENGFINYGRYLTTSTNYVLQEANWMKFAQAHGAAVLINQGWASLTVGAPQRDYSAATYLLGNEQAAALFVAPHTGYGVETYYHPEYTAANIGAPCGEYYAAGSTAPAIFYRKFANAFVVVNAGGSGTESARLPTGHAYVDLEGRLVTNPLPVAANDGYVLKTTNGCL